MTNFEPRMPGIPRSQGLLGHQMGKDPSQPDVHGEAERCAWGKISPFPHGLGLPAPRTTRNDKFMDPENSKDLK